MWIASIKLDSPGEVEGEFSHLIYFQGCNRNCCYCFNPELRQRPMNPEEDAKYEMTVKEVMDILDKRTFDGPVILTGGEPAIQWNYPLLEELKKKKYYTILETSYHTDKWKLVDKVLFCIKTFDLNDRALKAIDKHDNVIPVVVVGHPCFNEEGFKKAVRIIKKDIYIRYYNDNPAPATKIYRILKTNKKKLNVFKKICL